MTHLRVATHLVQLFIFICFASCALAAVFEIAIPTFIGDPKRDQVVEAARDAAEVAQTESLADVGAQLQINYRVIPRFSVTTPLAHVTLTSELITPRTVAAFDATRGDVRLPGFILGNASLTYLTFDATILASSPTSINLDFDQVIWAKLTATALKKLSISRVGSIYTSSASNAFTSFSALAPQNDIQIACSFSSSIATADIRFRLAGARSLGVVYFVVFGSAADLFTVVNLAAKEKFFFEYIWVATGRAQLAQNDYNELYATFKPDPKFFSGAVVLMLPTGSNVSILFRSLERRAPNLFSLSKKRSNLLYGDIDDRVVIVHDYVRLVGATIGEMLRNGQDPLTARGDLPSFNTTAPFLPFLLNTSRSFLGTSGRMTFDSSFSRDGEIGLFNWRLSNGSTTWIQLGSFASGDFQWLPGLSKNRVRWSTSTATSALVDTWLQPNPSAPRMLKVGIIYRLSTYISQSPEWLIALKWAADRMNANHLSYYQLSLEYLDLGASSAAAVRILRQWIDASGPSLIIGPTTSASASALVPLAQDANVPMISPNAPAESLSNQFYYRGFTRVSDSDRNWARSFFSFMRKMRWSTFSAISSSDEDRVMDEVVLSLPSDFRVSERQSFEFFSSTVYSLESITHALESAKSAGTRVILFRATVNAHAIVLSIAKRLGMFGPGTPYVWIFGIDVRFLYINDPTLDFNGLKPMDFAGSFCLSPATRPGQETPEQSKKVFDELIDHLSNNTELRDNDIDDYTGWSPEMLTAFWVDSLLAAATAVEDLYQKDGLQAQNGSLILYHLLNARFYGTTGLVTMNEFGSRTNLTQIGANFNGSHWVRIFTYSNSTGIGQLLREPAQMTWADGRQYAPLDRFGMPRHDGVGIAIILVTALVQLIFVGTAAITLKFREDKIIFSSSPLFLCLILTGLALVLSTNYIWLGEPWLGSCVAQKFFFYVGFTIALGALLIKNWRLYALFNDSSMQVIAITNKRLLAYMSIAVSVPIIVLILWSAIDAPLPSPAHLSGFWCAAQSGTPAWDIVINSFSIAAMVVAAVLAFMTRNLPGIYNEAKFIGFASYNLLITLLGGLALAYFIQPAAGVSAGLIVASFSLILSCGGVYAFIFAPKLYIMFFEPDKVSQLWGDRTALGGTGTGTSRTKTASGGRYGSGNNSGRGSSVEMRSQNSNKAEYGSNGKRSGGVGQSNKSSSAAVESD